MYDHTVVKGMVQERGGRDREREREGNGRWVDLGCLITTGLSKDIQCMCYHTVLNSMCAERDNGNIMTEEEREVGGFGLFNDTWSQ